MAQNCSNCYDGCVQITSDRCVKYTGVDVPVLGILKGDSLSYVEQALITFLTATLNGSGITIDIDEDLYCELVSQYLQECETVTALDLFKALVQAACNLQEQVDAVVADIAVIEADYDVECLEGVVADAGTHDVLQAVITKLCEINEELTALAIDLDVNYVKIADLDGYIQTFLDNNTASNRYSSRMIPYTVVEYYGSLTFFDATGAGLPDTEWEDIYLCNGLNGTPDKRGRVPVGAIASVPGGTLDSSVDPASDPAFNPNYALGDVGGENKVTITIAQMPTHAHGVTDPTHTHILAVDDDGAVDLLAGGYLATSSSGEGDDDYVLKNATLGTGLTPDKGRVAFNSTGVSIQNTGSGEAHDNKQPSLACYYIMYIP